MRIEVMVTPEDLEHGQKNHPEKCAVALALRRSREAIAGRAGMSIDPEAPVKTLHEQSRILRHADRNHSAISLWHSTGIKRYIAAFDRGDPVDPKTIVVSWQDEDVPDGPERPAFSRLIFGRARFQDEEETTDF